MAFGNISTLYLPTAANAGSSQWGTDVRKLLDSADAGSDTTTITSHGTGGATQRTFDPYSTSSTDATEDTLGWAVTPTDMNSVSGARRFFPAGDHVLTVRMGSNSVSSANGTLYMYAYRVAPAGSSRTRTLLGSATGAVTLPGLSGQVTATVTLTLGEVVFDADETIQYSFEFNIAGVVISGRNVMLHTGTSTVQCRIDTPGLKTLADTTGTASGTGSATGTSGKVLGTQGTTTGAGSASGAMSARADTTGSAAGTGTASAQASSVAGAVGTTSGSASVSGALGAVGSMTGSAAGSGTVTGVLGGSGGMIGSSAGTGSASAVMSATAGTVGAAVGVASATAQASSVAGAVGSALGTSTATGLTSIVLGTVGTVAIGAPSSDVPDWPIVDATRQIAGTVIHHETAIAVAGATVRLFRTLDDAQMTFGVSAGDGSYSFPRDTSDPYSYYVVAEYVDAGTPIHGVTDRGLVPTLI